MASITAKKAESKTVDEVDLGYAGEPKVVNREFTYPTHTDPRRMADSTGIYLDDVQREAAEVVRAKIEGREPDLENPPATQGTPLMATYIVKSQVPADYVVEADVVLPVVVGVHKDNTEGNAEAKRQQVADHNKDKA